MPSGLGLSPLGTSALGSGAAEVIFDTLAVATLATNGASGAMLDTDGTSKAELTVADSVASVLATDGTSQSTLEWNGAGQAVLTPLDSTAILDNDGASQAAIQIA